MSNNGYDHERLASDFATLRQEGVSDDDILKSYREYAPRHSSDIDALVGEGVKARAILDNLVEYQAKYPSIAPQPSPQDNEGVLEKSKKALQYGAAQAATGIGRSAHWLGEASGIDTAKAAGEALTGFGKSIAPENYKPASEDFFDPRGRDKGVGGFGWGYLPRMILEGAPGLVMDVGAGAATGGAGFLASNAARAFGPSMDARVENNGGKPVSATDYAAAGGSAALQAYLNKLGLNPALSGVTKGAGLAAISQIPGQVAKAGATDALAGAAGEMVSQTGQTLGTEKGLTISPHEIIGAGASSGAMGGAVRGLRGAGDVTNAMRYADMDPVVAERLANRFSKLGIEPKDPESAFKAVKAAEQTITSEATRARNDLFTKMGREEGNKHRDLIDDTEILLSSGQTLAGGRLDQLREAVGPSKQAQRYIEKLQERSALNDLKSKGRYEENYFAGGLSSSTLAEDAINPASWMRSPARQAIGSTAAMISLGSEVATAAKLLHPLALAKGLAAQSAAYGGLRAVDAVTGSRNPLREFTSRFAGDGVETTSREPQFDRAIAPEERQAMIDGVQKAARKAVGAQRARQTGKGSSEASVGADESPSGAGERVNPRGIRIETRGYSVDRPLEGIVNVDRYAAKTKAHMETRANFGDELGVVADGRDSAVRSLVNKMNHQARSFDEAASYIEDAINELPWEKRSQAWDTYLKHEPALRATYRA